MRIALKLGLTLAICINAGDGWAITVGSYEALKKSDMDIAKVYLTGVGEGISIINSYIVSKGGNPLYCQPELLGLTMDNYHDIYEKKLEQSRVMFKDGGREKDFADLPVAMILHYGILETFPCD
jgi:hypothetical protein